MSTFIRKAACNGHRPAHLGHLDIVRRPDLVSRLLKDRKSARFIFAPQGYGKTSLAVDYCETVFRFSHVLWIKAKSPCFLRDLDAGIIARDVEEVDDEAALVVFDDVPVMDALRCETFADQIERMLERNCEVLVLATPSARMCADEFGVKFLMSSVDLLLSDREVASGRRVAVANRTTGSIEAYRSLEDGSSVDDGTNASIANRIPALAWSTGPDDLPAFLVGAFQEEFEERVCCVLVSIMLLGSGEMSDVMNLCKIEEADLAHMIATYYPHCGVDESTDRFDTCAFPFENVVLAVRLLVGKMAATDRWRSRSDIVDAWACYAFENKMHERACDIVRLLMPRSGRAPWVADHARDLIRAGAFLATKRVIDASQNQAGSVRSILAMVDATCCLLLDDVDSAIDCAKRQAFASGTAPSIRLLAASMLVRHAPGILAEKAADLICESLGNDSDAVLEDSLFAVTVARGALCFAEGADRLMGFLEYECSETIIREPEALCVLSSWLLDTIVRIRESSFEPLPAPGLPGSVESFVYEQIESLENSDSNMFVATAGIALEAARTKGIVTCRGVPSASAMLAIRRAEASVFAQRIQYKLDRSQAREMKLNRLETHPDNLLSANHAIGTPPRRSTPVLTVRLFGRLEIAIGGTPVDQKIAKRRKVMKLFLILAINHGREVNRDRICEQLWPGSSMEVSRKSFYNTYSLLKHALSLPDGTCPYLIRRSLTCSLDDRNVETDVMRLDAICREFLFGEPDDMHWSALYREVDRDFRDDLLAAEEEDEYLDAARNDLRMRLVDALTAASRRITEAGIPERGIWFARSAIHHDKMREDAYIALMIAQNNANQRAAAILTYVNLRKMLGEELGVDPSPEAQRVYERIVMSDGEMVTAGC